MYSIAKSKSAWLRERSTIVQAATIHGIRVARTRQIRAIGAVGWNTPISAGEVPARVGLGPPAGGVPTNAGAALHRGGAGGAGRVVLARSWAQAPASSAP